ncbi:MAG: biotin/lipoyl-containing protein, partial [Pseudomonadota bacterium]|nr:biotin/lipoyl-containing protein [Pseudomonadota bacterium]
MTENNISDQGGVLVTLIKAESAAIVAEVHVAPGQEVAAGTVLLATELMKMRHEIRAEQSGIVTAVHVTAGQELQGGETLITLEPGSVSVEEVATDDTAHPDLEEYAARMALLDDAARPEAVAKRHALGGRTARENINDLFDAGSFTEYGALAVAAQRGKRALPD